MFKILCVTNRSLCCESFLARIERIASAQPDAIVLREKDMTESEYIALAGKVSDICRRYETPLILHSFADAAIALGIKNIHLPMHALQELSQEQRGFFETIGASCHSVVDAMQAQQLGCTYITAGHVFETDCKKGLPARGIAFLSDICRSVTIPVYAIGGIDEKNISQVAEAGAYGAAVMSAMMQCDEPQSYIRLLKGSKSNEI